MPTLLHIDSSPMGDASITRHLTREFVQNWQAAHSDGTVIARDLTAAPIPTIDAEWVGASFTPAANRTDSQRQILAISDEFITELRSADEYVIGVPMHNFTIPASLRLWIDQIARAGETFSYDGVHPKGLLSGKKATLLIASGGIYGEGTPLASYNFVEPYLRTVFGFIGVDQLNIIAAGGASALRTGSTDLETFLQPHVKSIHANFQATAV